MTRGYSWSLAFTIQGLTPFDLYRLLPALSICPLLTLLIRYAYKTNSRLHGIREYVIFIT